MSVSGTNEATQSVPFGTDVVATGNATSNGSSSTPARSDHVHKGVVAADAWTSYTPTLTQSGAVTKTVNYAKYAQIGKTVICQVYMTCTGAGTAANAVVLGLPVTAASSLNLSCGTGEIFDSSASLTYKATAIFASTTTIFLRATNTTVAGVLGADAFTAALATGDVITFFVTYEAA